MPIDRFINERKTVWQRLEALLELLDRMTLRRLKRAEVRELGHIYRRTASDLAIARAESRDPRLINYLNSLVIRAHGRIYRADAQGGRRIWNFFAHDFPLTFRRTWRYTAVTALVFFLFGSLSFLATRHDPDFSELADVNPEMRYRIESRIKWWEKLTMPIRLSPPLFSLTTSGLRPMNSHSARCSELERFFGPLILALIPALSLH